MKNRRVVKGNFTTVPTGADLLGEYYTNAVTAQVGPIEEPSPVQEENIVVSRNFMQENEK